MTGAEKYKYWEMLADYDMETAKALMDAKRWTYVVVICQQAVERLVKGMHVFHTGREAPKSHNIPFLINKLAENKKFEESPVKNRFIEEKSDYDDFFIDIMFYYMTDYPFSYKKIMDRFIKEDIATEIFDKTTELFGWLKSFQN